MDFPRPSVSPSNIIGDLKDRFGFGGAKQRAYDEEPYYDAVSYTHLTLPTT